MVADDELRITLTPGDDPPAPPFGLVIDLSEYQVAPEAARAMVATARPNVEARRLLVMLEPPEDGRTHMSHAAGVVTQLSFSGNIITAEVELLATEKGRAVAALGDEEFTRLKPKLVGIGGDQPKLSAISLWKRPPTDPSDIEALAAAEHTSWMGWTKYMLERLESELDAIQVGGRSALRALPCVKRWRYQMVTPYEELPEEMRESDRKEAREKLKVYRP